MPPVASSSSSSSSTGGGGTAPTTGAATSTDAAVGQQLPLRQLSTLQFNEKRFDKVRYSDLDSIELLRFALSFPEAQRSSYSTWKGFDFKGHPHQSHQSHYRNVIAPRLEYWIGKMRERDAELARWKQRDQEKGENETAGKEPAAVDGKERVPRPDAGVKEGLSGASEDHAEEADHNSNDNSDSEDSSEFSLDLGNLNSKEGDVEAIPSVWEMLCPEFDGEFLCPAQREAMEAIVRNEQDVVLHGLLGKSLAYLFPVSLTYGLCVVITTRPHEHSEKVRRLVGMNIGHGSIGRELYDSKPMSQKFIHWSSNPVVQEIHDSCTVEALQEASQRGSSIAGGAPPHGKTTCDEEPPNTQQRAEKAAGDLKRRVDEAMDPALRRKRLQKEREEEETRAAALQQELLYNNNATSSTTTGGAATSTEMNFFYNGASSFSSYNTTSRRRFSVLFLHPIYLEKEKALKKSSTLIKVLQTAIQKRPGTYFVIDEAHCLSPASKCFRAEMDPARHVKEIFGEDTPVVACVGPCPDVKKCGLLDRVEAELKLRPDTKRFEMVPKPEALQELEMEVCQVPEKETKQLYDNYVAGQVVTRVKQLLHANRCVVICEDKPQLQHLKSVFLSSEAGFEDDRRALVVEDLTKRLSPQNRVPPTQIIRDATPKIPFDQKKVLKKPTLAYLHTNMKVAERQLMQKRWSMDANCKVLILTANVGKGSAARLPSVGPVSLVIHYSAAAVRNLSRLAEDVAVLLHADPREQEVKEDDDEVVKVNDHKNKADAEAINIRPGVQHQQQREAVLYWDGKERLPQGGGKEAAAHQSANNLSHLARLKRSIVDNDKTQTETATECCKELRSYLQAGVKANIKGNNNAADAAKAFFLAKFSLHKQAGISVSSIDRWNSGAGSATSAASSSNKAAGNILKQAQQVTGPTTTAASSSKRKMDPTQAVQQGDHGASDNVNIRAKTAQEEEDAAVERQLLKQTQLAQKAAAAVKTRNKRGSNPLVSGGAGGASSSSTQRPGGMFANFATFNKKENKNGTKPVLPSGKVLATASTAASAAGAPVVAPGIKEPENNQTAFSGAEIQSKKKETTEVDLSSLSHQDFLQKLLSEKASTTRAPPGKGPPAEMRVGDVASSSSSLASTFFLQPSTTVATSLPKNKNISRKNSKDAAQQPLSRANSTITSLSRQEQKELAKEYQQDLPAKVRKVDRYMGEKMASFAALEVADLGRNKDQVEQARTTSKRPAAPSKEAPSTSTGEQQSQQPSAKRQKKAVLSRQHTDILPDNTQKVATTSGADTTHNAFTGKNYQQKSLKERKASDDIMVLDSSDDESQNKEGPKQPGQVVPNNITTTGNKSASTLKQQGAGGATSSSSSSLIGGKQAAQVQESQPRPAQQSSSTSNGAPSVAAPSAARPALASVGAQASILDRLKAAQNPKGGGAGVSSGNTTVVGGRPAGGATSKQPPGFTFSTTGGSTSAIGTATLQPAATAKSSVISDVPVSSRVVRPNDAAPAAAQRQPPAASKPAGNKIKAAGEVLPKATKKKQESMKKQPPRPPASPQRRRSLIESGNNDARPSLLQANKPKEDFFQGIIGTAGNSAAAATARAINGAFNKDFSNNLSGAAKQQLATSMRPAPTS
ncbi:unnamed protein product [Amoebophrya sp. A120]|nr:unnamed protein product [Amoebophrya sp. A120]|eukprot:GSA120T00013008001.1